MSPSVYMMIYRIVSLCRLHILKSKAGILDLHSGTSSLSFNSSLKLPQLCESTILNCRITPISFSVWNICDAGGAVPAELFFLTQRDEG